MPSSSCLNIISFYYVFMLFISITLSQFSKTHTICSQTYCNLIQCPDTLGCLHGLAEDECRCCQVCLKANGEICAPNDKCAKGLKCLFPQSFDSINTNLVNSDQEVGVCGQLNCTGVICDNTIVTNHIKCPKDSYKLLEATSSSCCQITCVCKPDVCNDSQNVCPTSKREHIVVPGNGKPGSCCNQIECIEDPTKCIHNNKLYMNGDKWKADKCTDCECRDGLSFCNKTECKQVVHKNCKVIAVVEDQCCPICQGCISSDGKYYNNTHNWYENDCSQCECNNGQISCKVQMCGPVHCDKPIYIDGQCCPVCPTKSINSCNIDCPMGYKRNAFGYELCECDHCFNKSFKCKIFCPFGYKKGSDGCPICQCLTLDNINQSVDQMLDSVCTLNNGSVVTSGLFWSDGCRECYCKSAKVMCTQPNCPPIQCTNAIVITNQCCPVCDQHTNKDAKQNIDLMTSGHIHSHLMIAAIILTLIIAILLLGIFILLAFYIIKKYSNIKYIRNRVMNGENGIIRLWPYTTRTAHTCEAPDKHEFVGIEVQNANNNLLIDDCLHIDDTLEHTLLTTSSSPTH